MLTSDFCHVDMRNMHVPLPSIFEKTCNVTDANMHVTDVSMHVTDVADVNIHKMDVTYMFEGTTVCFYT